MTAPFLRLAGVTKRYGHRTAVDGVSLDARIGESVVILGPSGCGKTTVLRLMAGLERPDAGEIWIDGRAVAREGRNLVPPYERRLGYVFQDLALWPHLTVARQLEFVLDSAGIPRAEHPARVGDTLKLVRVEHLTARYPHELSGGEQQRVALARALVGKPGVLLLDEPLSSLDVELRATVRAELVRLQRTLRITAAYVTHDREDAAALADRIVQMRDGRVVGVSEVRKREERA